MNTEHKDWQVETATSSRSDNIEYFIRRDGNNIAIASEIINPETKQPSKDIADLICAAPELLEALKATLAELKEFWRILVISVSHGERMGGWLEDVEGMIARIESAITKAEGKA